MPSPPPRSTGFANPSDPLALSQASKLASAGSYRRSVRLPRSVRGELATLAAATRRAADSGLKSGVTQLQRTLLHRITMGPSVVDYARIEAIGYRAYLDEQLDYESLDDRELEDSLAAELPTLEMSAQTLFREYGDNPFIPILELWIATVLRAVYSPRQLYERMTVFWTDHFNIDIFVQPQPQLRPVDYRRVVRAHAMGTFPELLSASAHSPAMLLYLTNDTNAKGHPNENYARELMELHTMGADNGYTETDVKEVARCFTGWTWVSPFRDRGEVGTFQFRDADHDTAKKRVLGTAMAAGGGIGDGETVLDILVDRKETRQFIASKMLRWLWGYEPRKNAIKRVAKAYKKSGGDIREMLREALSKKRLGSATTKLKRPFHLTSATLRAMGAEISDVRFALQGLRETGHIPFSWGPPDGYPDSVEYWSGLILPRWNSAAKLFESQGLSWDPSLDDASGTPQSIVDRLDTTFLGGTMTKATRQQIESYLGGKSITRKRVREAISLTLSSPEFQEY